MTLCPCGSKHAYADCCQPFHLEQQYPTQPEQLMRSRFSAYALHLFQYILDTYSTEQRQALSIDMLSNDSEDTIWLGLDVIDSDSSEVEFKAYYAVNKQVYVMHERSTFIQESGKWRYDTGVIHDDTGAVKIKRNDPCICHSGKKFKQCCMLTHKLS